jgi:hypothetical protein
MPIIEPPAHSSRPDPTPSADAEASIALIIPIGPADQSWRGLLPFLTDLPPAVEVCFSACEGRPSDADLAPHWHWLVGPAGRARQLNLASRASRGQWLWWLHADSLPAADALSALRRSIGQAPTALHWFALAFHDGPRLSALNAAGANLRSRAFGLPFGDQGLCLRRTDFDALGGFDEHCGRGEDLDLVLRARRAGIPLARVASTLSSSARRYREHGWLRTTLSHLRGTWTIRRRFRF